MPRNVTVVDLGWNRIRAAAKMLDGAGVKVGLTGKADKDDLQKAALNEFGTEDIPARPFMRHTADTKERQARQVGRNLAGSLIDGKVTVEQVLDRLGNWYQGEVKKTVRDSKSWAVPNAPATLEQKKGDRPLLDTESMEGSIQYEKVHRR